MHRIVRAIDRVVDRLSNTVARSSRYDLVLTLIPASFLVATGLGTALSVPTTTAVLAAAAVSGLVVLDALFFNPPREPSAGQPRW